jgi:hypothetical protein
MIQAKLAAEILTAAGTIMFTFLFLIPEVKEKLRK